MSIINKKIAKRIIDESKYIIKTGKTIRVVAEEFQVSKSTVHKDLSERLIELNEKMYTEVSRILKYHLDIRHIRGGESTKAKFLTKNAN